MRRFRPIHGVALVLVFFAAVLAAEWLLEGGLRRQAFERVSPDTNGMVILDVSDLGPNQVRFYRFLNAGNQEIKFFLGRDEHGVIQAAFDASENDFKMKRGFRYHDGWMVNNKCETSVRLTEVNQGGGCRPVPLTHRVVGARVQLTEAAILEGWRLFR